MAGKLQGGLPAISLSAHTALNSAFSNDVDPRLVYAQQVWGYAREGDVLLGISTSGNAENVCCAAMAAKVRGATVLALTGRDGGRLAELADCSLIAPEQETYRIQEVHLAVYHLLCAVVESELFS
ncbi:SIS domain-containing protein [Clostridium sp. D33t1_170424_F3]|uniref:D-sedoheptulose-7-phosphate isomerase n=1 Tax=Clostridium sp. D33t1_170424_F3 TaxID=2787099 RepID=UPI00336A197D